MDEAAKAGKSIRKAGRSFVNYKTKMTSLCRPDGTVTASRRAMEKVIYDFHLNLFDSHVYLPTHHLGQDEYIAPSVLPSEIRHAITSMKNNTAPGPDRIKPEFLKSISPVIIKTLAGSSHGVPSQYIRMLRELYDNFTTRIAPFHKIPEGGHYQREERCQAGRYHFAQTFQFRSREYMRHLEWEDLGVKVDGRYLHHLRFADDIVLIHRTSGTNAGRV
uniref:Reverse transcriptase domain-containing protein n=1 Tax=Haemonchus contortus TaxID=6289 RepID=A0A7I4YWJ9_HAECO